jgi:hypothetical protein
MSELTAEPATVVISSIQDKTAAETKVDTEASTVEQDNTLLTQTEDPTIEQVKRDAQIESIEPAVQEAVVSEETNPERSSVAVKYSNGHPDINSLDVDQIVGERIEESLVPSDEVNQEPRVDEVGPEFDSVSPPITDELLTTESSVIDHTVEGPQEESAPNDNASDRPEILSHANIMATDETAQAPVEMQSFNETKAPETHALNGNGHSTTTQETIGTHEASSVNFATDEDNIQSDPVIESIHLTHISPATLEAPSITD